MRVLYYLRLHNVPDMLQAHYLQERVGAYLSRHGRLAGLPKAAAFDSEALAQQVLALWWPTLKFRWGDAFHADVEKVTHHGRVSADAALDAATLLARARTGRFASNQAVPAEALEAELAELSGQTTWSAGGSR